MLTLKELDDYIRCKREDPQLECFYECFKDTLHNIVTEILEFLIMEHSAHDIATRTSYPIRFVNKVKRKAVKFRFVKPLNNSYISQRLKQLSESVNGLSVNYTTKMK